VSLQDWAAVANIVASVALVVSALLLFRELHATNKLARASNTQTLVALSSPFNLALIQDRKVAEFYVHGASEFSHMDDVDKYRYYSLLVWWLILHENIYYQWQQGLLDDHSYKPWANELKVFLARQGVASQWNHMRNLFQEEFANHVGRLLADTEGKGASDRTPTGSSTASITPQ